jgi:hypothetical protein
MQGHHHQIDKGPLLALPIHAPARLQQQKVARIVEKLIRAARNQDIGRAGRALPVVQTA